MCYESGCLFSGDRVEIKEEVFGENKEEEDASQVSLCLSYNKMLNISNPKLRK